MARCCEVVDLGEDAGGRGMRATAAISAGVTVLTSTAMCMVPFDKHRDTVCCLCLQQVQNPERHKCRKCGLVILCGQCDTATHDQECTSIQHLFAPGGLTEGLTETTSLRLLLRLIYAWQRDPEGFTDVFGLEGHEDIVPDSLFEVFEHTAKQLKYILTAGARRSLETYVSMICRLYCNSFTVTLDSGSNVGVYDLSI